MTGTTRRNFLLLSGLAAVAGGWQWYIGRPQDIAFEPISGLPGWRSTVFEGVSLPGGSATGAVLLGIGDDDPVQPLPPKDLCAFLYPTADARLSAAIFTDINCPNCASLEAKLATRRDRLNLRFIDLPLLGPFSEAAARVSVAAELLSGVPSEPPRVLRGRGIAPVIQYHAARSGLDTEVLNDETDTVRVKEQLALHHRAAETLGVWGTPALVLGTTLIMGDLDPETLDRVIELETARAQGCS